MINSKNNLTSVRVTPEANKLLMGFKNKTEVVRIALTILKDVCENKLDDKKLNEYQTILNYQKIQ